MQLALVDDRDLAAAREAEVVVERELVDAVLVEELVRRRDPAGRPFPSRYRSRELLRGSVSLRPLLSRVPCVTGQLKGNNA